jgi:hypothetical protein
VSCCGLYLEAVQEITMSPWNSVNYDLKWGTYIAITIIIDVALEHLESSQ